MYIELCEYDEVSIFTHMTHKLYEYHHFLVFFLIHVFLIVLLQDTCGHIEEIKSVTSRKLHQQKTTSPMCSAAPCSSQSRLSLCFGGSARLV